MECGSNAKKQLQLDNFACRENIAVDEYCNYYFNVKNNMEHPEWLGDLTKEDFIYLMNNEAKSWTYFDGDKFVCSVMYIPATQKAIEHLGLKYDKKECAECGSMFVAKEYRGNSLQFQMFEILKKYCKERKFKYILTTAEPNNIYSSNNMEKAGYEKIGFKILERGPRNIYVQKL